MTSSALFFMLVIGITHPVEALGFQAIESAESRPAAHPDIVLDLVADVYCDENPMFSDISRQKAQQRGAAFFKMLAIFGFGAVCLFYYAGRKR